MKHIKNCRVKKRKQKIIETSDIKHFSYFSNRWSAYDAGQWSVVFDDVQALRALLVFRRRHVRSVLQESDEIRTNLRDVGTYY